MPFRGGLASGLGFDGPTISWGRSNAVLFSRLRVEKGRFKAIVAFCFGAALAAKHLFGEDRKMTNGAGKHGKTKAKPSSDRPKGDGSKGAKSSESRAQERRQWSFRSLLSRWF